LSWLKSERRCASRCGALSRGAPRSRCASWPPQLRRLKVGGRRAPRSAARWRCRAGPRAPARRLRSAMDSSRIQGIGNDGATILRCPAGHCLHSWVARAGTCDGCQRFVEDGEEVMDCRQCNWYLCRTCEATYKPPDTSMWGSFVSFLNAADRSCHDVESAFAEDGFGAPVSNEDAQRAATDGVTSHDNQAADELIAGFCAGHREHSVVPDAVELDALWSRCCLLYGCVLDPGPLASAIVAQLAWAEGCGEPWQPRLRALCVLEMLGKKGAVGREIAGATGPEGEGLVRRLLDVPECAERAAVVLQGLEEVRAFQEACF
ncbi:unnamed protein product, partial [Prorocentrum cordatum]